MSEWPSVADLESLIERQAALIARLRGAEERMRERAAKAIENFKTNQPNVGITWWGEALAEVIRELPLEKTQ